MVKIQALSLFIKNCTAIVLFKKTEYISQHRMWSIERLFSRGFFFVFLLSKPWPLYRIDMSLMQISMVPMYLYVRECTYTLETYNYSTCQVGDKGGGGGFMEPLLQEGQKMLNFASSPCCSGRYRHEGRHRC